MIATPRVTHSSQQPDSTAKQEKPSGHSSGYIPSLDGIRAVAVGLVLLAHAGYGDIVPGGMGVSIFFLLSGYLITTLFFRELASTGKISLGAFYLRRVLRLNPPLLVSLACGYGLLALGLAVGEFEVRTLLAQIFYLANYYQLYGEVGKSLVEGQYVLWSLAVEEHFYMFYPLLFLWLIRRKTVKAQIVPIVVLLMLGLVWRFVLHNVLGASTTHIFYATDSRLDSILYGSFLAFLVHRTPIEKYFPKTLSAAWKAELAGGVLLLVTLVVRDPTFRETLRYTLQGIALLPLFYYAVALPHAPQHRFLNWGWMRKIGIYSYSIYLIHDVVMCSLSERFGWTSKPAILLVGTSVGVAYAALLYKFVDVPMLKLRRKLHGGH